VKKIEFKIDDIDLVISKLTNTLSGLNKYWKENVLDLYENYSNGRLDYVDIAEISHFIKDRIRDNNVADFNLLFNEIELILNNCDSKIENFITIGLLESIQNICGHENINYWTGFDNWLGSKTKVEWRNIILNWERENGKEMIAKMNKNKLI